MNSHRGGVLSWVANNVTNRENAICSRNVKITNHQNSEREARPLKTRHFNKTVLTDSL